MNQATHYFELVRMGLGVFVRSAAAAALVRSGPDDPPDALEAVAASTSEFWGDGVSAAPVPPPCPLQVFPLAKKRGAPFAEMITLGRTSNNDVVIDHATVSRLHAFFRRSESKQWGIADTGSKNGTFVDGERLEARKERPLASGDHLRFGSVRVTFYTAEDLYRVLRDNLSAAQ